MLKKNRIISLFLAFIMIFTMLPLNVFANYNNGSMGNLGGGSYVYVPPKNAPAGDFSLVNPLNSMNGYKVTVWFAEKIGEELGVNGQVIPIYGWGDETKTEQVGRTLFMRRDFLLDKSGNPVNLAFWNNDGIYSQTTLGRTWEGGRISAQTPDAKLLYSATEWFRTSTADVFNGMWIINTLGYSIGYINNVGFSLYEICYDDPETASKYGLPEVRDFFARIFNMENPDVVDLERIYEIFYKYYVLEYKQDINAIDPHAPKPGTYYYNAIINLIREYFGVNINENSPYEDIRAALQNKPVMIDFNDFNLPFPDAMTSSRTPKNGKNDATPEYIKSYFLNSIILNELSYNSRPEGHTGGRWSPGDFIYGRLAKLNDDGTNVYNADGSKDYKIGQYKIYVEPVMFRKYEGKGIGVMSWRDFMLQRQSESNYRKWFMADFGVAVPQISNALMLEHEDESLMTSAGVVGSRSNDYKQLTTADCEGQGKGMYAAADNLTNALGVGVFTSPSVAAGAPLGPEIVEFYVAIEAVNSDGSVSYIQVAEPKKYQADFNKDDLGNYTLNPIFSDETKTDVGIGILNDVFTTPYDITLSKDSKWEDTNLPINVLENNKELMSDAKDIASHAFALITGSDLFIKSYEKYLGYSNDSYAQIKASQDAIEEVFTFKDENVASADEAIKLIRKYDAAQGGNVVTIHKVVNSKELIKTDDVEIGQLVENHVEKIDFTIETDENGQESLVAATTATTPANTLVLRYIVSPKAKQINIIEVVKQDGTKEYFNGGIQPLHKDGDTVTIQDPDLENFAFEEEPEIVEWVTNSEYPIIEVIDGDLPPKSEGGKEGTTQDDISNYPEEPLTHNLYVKWKITEPAPPIPGQLEVPEWRLSKYWEGYKDDEGEEGIPSTTTGMSLLVSYGSCCKSPSLSNSGPWNYTPVNANGKIDKDKHDPANLELYSWLHSESIHSGQKPYIGLYTPAALVKISANINAIKSTDTAGLKAAKWLDDKWKNDSGTYTLDAYDVTKSYTSGTETQDYAKDFELTLKTHNDDTYVNKYQKCRCTSKKHRHTNKSKTLSPDSAYVIYASGTISDLNVKFNRYNQEANSNLFTVAPEVKNNNGFSSMRYQLNETLNIYPEYGMLFTDDDQDNMIKWMVGDEVRQIKPVVYQSLEHKVWVKPTSTGTSVANDSRGITKANSIGEAGKQIIYKGAGVNTNFRLYQSKDSNKVGLLTVKTYALDFKSGSHYNQFNGSGSAWGNNYNSYDEHSALLTNITSSNKASVTEKLLVDSPAFNSLDYTGADKRSTSNPYKLINYKNNPSATNMSVVDGGNAVMFEHELIVRGGHLIGVKYNDRQGKSNSTSPISITELKSKDESLYNAILSMGLYTEDNNKDNTVFKVFEHKDGDKLTEGTYATELASARKTMDGEIATPDYAAIKNGDKWYSEDTTVLVIREYVSNFEVPSISVSDKLSMTVNGLNTPANKAQFFSTMGKGHTYLKYNLAVTPPAVSNIGTGKVNAYFEFSSFAGDNLLFGEQEVNYLVPNVSITDTTRMN